MASTVPLEPLDGRVVDVPEAVLAGAGGQFAFEDDVADRVPAATLVQESLRSLERDDLGDAAAEDLLCWEADGLGLAVVDAEVAKLDGIEEREADGGGAVDGLELGPLALGLLLALTQSLGEVFTIGDVDGKTAEP